MSIDFDAIRSAYPIESVIGRHVDLKRNGRELSGLCPFHGEKTPSFTVYKDRFHCFGCAADGDVIDFMAQLHKCSLPQAAEILGGAEATVTIAKPKPAPPEFIQSDPPDDAPRPETGGAHHVYVYRDAAGKPLRYILRWDTPNGKKIGARTWGTLNGVEGWHPKQATARDLYGLELLAARPNDPVLVVEGEKACEAARSKFPGYVVVTWSGGTEAVRKTDWTPLNDRQVIVWPDNDHPGWKAAGVIAGLIQVQILDVHDLPEASDAADLPAPADPDAWIEARLPAAEDEVPAAEDYPDDAEPQIPRAGNPEEVIPLGHDHGVFYYFSSSSRQVWALTAEKHSQATFAGMASVAHYWSRMPQHMTEKGGINWQSVADWLMTACRTIGIYDPRRLRGRGAWMDDGNIIVHLGDKVTVNGEQAALDTIRSHYIYEAGPRLVPEIAEHATTQEAHWLFKVCNLLRWERAIDGTLFAGWLALAPICGALEWRPSVFLTGASGSGKTWIVSNIIIPAINGFALHVGSSTTEAFLRQSLGSDALPVIFDEAEREGPKAANMMQEVMQLVRQSSSEGGGVIGKGGQSGKPTSYRIRSMFCFQAINVAMANRADETRITVLSLRGTSNERDISFDDLAACVAERITKAACERIISRTISLIPVIRHNAQVFAAAIEKAMGSRRIGDQTGTLLAGAYSLHSSRRISAVDAAKYIAERLDQAARDEPDRDEVRLLNRLLEHKIRVGQIETPVGTLISLAFSEGTETQVLRDEATRELGNVGIKALVIGGIMGIAVASSHSQMAKILAGTPWADAWARSLARLDNSRSGRDFDPVRFGPNIKSRAVWVPIPL
jgi:putative DNA primase/helicase